MFLGYKIVIQLRFCFPQHIGGSIREQQLKRVWLGNPRRGRVGLGVRRIKEPL